MLRISRHCLLGAVGATMIALTAHAENFTTAAEVKPILMATKPGWIAVREYDGKDLLYFTNLLSWRCGLISVSYSVNGGAATALDLEPCHEDTAQPNAMLMEDVLPFITQPLASIEKISVTVTFDDESVETADYERKAILIP